MRYTFLDLLGMNPLRPMIAFGGDDSSSDSSSSDDGGSSSSNTTSAPTEDITFTTIDLDTGEQDDVVTYSHMGNTYDNVFDYHDAVFGDDDDDPAPAPVVDTTPTYTDTSNIAGISDVSGVDYTVPDVEDDPLDPFGGAGPDIGADDDYVESGVGYTYDPIVSTGTGTSGEDASPAYDPIDTSYTDTSSISGVADASGVDDFFPDDDDDNYYEPPGFDFDGDGVTGEGSDVVGPGDDDPFVDIDDDPVTPVTPTPDPSDDVYVSPPSDETDFTQPVVPTTPVVVEPPAPPPPPPVYYDMFGNEYDNPDDAAIQDSLYELALSQEEEPVTPTLEAGFDVDTGGDLDPAGLYDPQPLADLNVPVPESYMPTSEDFMPGITGTDTPRAEENAIRALYGLPPLETETDAIQTDLDDLLGGGDDLVETTPTEADELALELGLPTVDLEDYTPTSAELYGGDVPQPMTVEEQVAQYGGSLLDDYDSASDEEAYGGMDAVDFVNEYKADRQAEDAMSNLQESGALDDTIITGTESTPTIVDTSSLEGVLAASEGPAEIDYGGRDFRDVAPDTSSTIANTIKAFEGYSDDTYYDVNAPRAGYGSDTKTDPVTGEVTKIEPGMTVTREEAEADLNRRLTTEFIPSVVDAVGADTFYAMNPATQAALTSIAYNYGAGWADKLPSLAEAARTGDNAIIADAIEDRAGDNDGINESRRLAEAEMVRSGATIDDDITSTVQGVVDTSPGAPASEITQIQEELAAAIEPSLLEQGLALGAQALIPGFGGMIADQLLTVGPEERQAIVDQHVRALERGATPLYDDEGNYTGFDRSTMGTFADEVLAADDITAFLPPTPDMSEEEIARRADADQDGIPDVERFEEVFEAQQAAADADPLGLSTEEGFIMTGDDGQVGTEDDREFFVTSGGDVVEVRGDGEGEDRDIVDLDLNPDDVDQVINEVLGITEEEEQGEDEPMNPCPEGYVLDPETNECVPIVEEDEGAGKPRFADTERELIRRELEEREAGEGLIIRKPKQFARGGPVDLDPNTYDFRGFDTDNPFDMNSILAMQKHQVGLNPFDESQMELYDLNRDGGIDTSDVTAGLQYINFMDDGVFNEQRANENDFFLYTPKMRMAARPTQELSTTVMPEPRPTTGAAGMSIGAPKQFAMGGVATPNIDKMLNTRRFAQGGAVTPNIDSFVRSLRG